MAKYFICCHIFITFASELTSFASENMVRQADIIAYARTRPEFSRREMLCSFKEHNIPFSSATIASSLVALTEAGVLRKVRRGVFAIADTRQQPFVPFFDDEMQSLESMIRIKFPFIRFCTWSSNDLKRFSHYVVNMDIIYVDVERTAMEAVFSSLINTDLERQVYLNPSSNDYSYYIYGKPTIVVRPLISEAPLIPYANDSNRIAVEKLMVDVAIDDDFISFQDYEALRFYRNIIDICIVNEAKLLRYATRRGCKDQIKNILDTTKQNEIID